MRRKKRVYVYGRPVVSEPPSRVKAWGYVMVRLAGAPKELLAEVAENLWRTRLEWRPVVVVQAVTSVNVYRQIMEFGALLKRQRCCDVWVDLCMTSLVSPRLRDNDLVMLYAINRLTLLRQTGYVFMRIVLTRETADHWSVLRARMQELSRHTEGMVVADRHKGNSSVPTVCMMQAPVRTDAYMPGVLVRPDGSIVRRGSVVDTPFGRLGTVPLMELCRALEDV